MSEFSPSSGPFYVAGGTLKPGTPSYITRKADGELYERLLVGDFCYVLTARQMGKSSLMASTAKRLEEDGVRTAIVDLTQIGTERGAADAAQWYFGVAYEIHKKLGILEPLRPWWQERADLPALQRLTEFFSEMVLTLGPGKFVVFVDEIDSTIGLTFADDFFAAIRACYNARATEPAFEQLTFALLGTASPDQLIQNPARTPFNVGHRIDLKDFTLHEAHILAVGLHVEAEVAARLLERIFYWTGGHPYLTQGLCRAVEEKSSEPATPEAIVDPLVGTLFLSPLAQREEFNLKDARARLTYGGVATRRLLRLYRRVREGQKVRDEPASALFAQLKLSGVVKIGGDGNLAVRNRVYAAVFTPQWIKSEMPADRGLRLAAAIFSAAVIGLVFYYEIAYPRIYVSQLQAAIESDAYAVAAPAYNKLRSIPFWRSYADELLAEFWDNRALQRVGLGKGNESRLFRLKAIEIKDTPRRRKAAAQAFLESNYTELPRIHLEGSPRKVGFLPNNLGIIFIETDGTVGTQERPGEAVRPLWHTETSSSVIDTGGKFVVELNEFYEGRLRSATTGSTICTLPAGDSAKFSPDGRVAGITDIHHERSIIVDTSNCKTIKTIPGHFSAMAFSSNGKFFAGTDGNRISVIDVNSGEPDGRVYRLHIPVPAVAMAFSQSGQYILAGDDAGRVYLWDHENTPFLNFPSSSFEFLDRIRAIEFRPDDRAFIIATDRWLFSYSLEGNTLRVRSARLLPGAWGGAFRFVPDCADCLEAVFGRDLYGNDGFFVEVIHLDEPDNPPIEGDAKGLLARWQKALGFYFDSKTGDFLSTTQEIPDSARVR